MGVNQGQSQTEGSFYTEFVLEVVNKVDQTDVAQALLIMEVKMPDFFDRGQLLDLKFCSKEKEAE